MPLSLFLPTHVIWVGDIDAALVICLYTLFNGCISFFWHCSFATFLCYLLYCMPNLMYTVNYLVEFYPILVSRHPRTALELTSWLRGPLWPLLCPLEVLTTFSVPHTAQITENTGANPYFFPIVVSYNDKLAENKVTIWYSGKSDTLFRQCVFSFNLE